MKPQKKKQKDNIVVEVRSTGYKEPKLEQFLTRMSSIIGISKEDASQRFSTRISTIIRVNNLLDREDRIVNKLQKTGVILRKVVGVPYAYLVENMDKKDISKLDLNRDGYIFIQNLSSMLAVLALDPQKNDYILDLCAAPGGKSTYIASLTNNQAHIDANDESAFRVIKMRKLIEQLGARNINTTCVDGTKYDFYTSSKYDKIIIDAPCSGEGLIYLGSENPLRYWHPKKVKRLSFLQSQLIEKSYKLLKKNGILVYSTCTVEPMENEQIVTDFLAKHPDMKLQSIDLKLDYLNMYLSSGKTSWMNTRYNPECKNCIRVDHSTETIPFFIAKFKKG